MRLPLLATLLALMPLPALADVTARYGADKDSIVIEVDDNGDSRFAFDKISVLRRGGVDYAMIVTPGGETKVAELAEILSLLESAMAGKVDKAPMEDANFVLIAKGEASVGARKGTSWSFGPDKERSGKPGELKDFVMSADPELAPLGAVIRHLVEVLKPLLNTIAPASTGFHAKALELAGKGAPLRLDTLELRSVDTADIDAKRFELPAPVVSAIEWFMAMDATGEGGAIMPLP